MVDDSEGVAVCVPIDFGQEFARRRGLSETLMRKTRLGMVRGYIACTRLRLGQNLMRETGRMEPHW